MTSDEYALLRGVLINPADDLPRLVYADWLEEHGRVKRAELIRLQIEIANSGRDGRTTAADVAREFEQRRRAVDLLMRKENAIDWRQLPYGMAPRSAFERGFLAEIECTPDIFSRSWHRIFSLHPVTRIKFRRMWPYEARGLWWWDDHLGVECHAITASVFARLTGQIATASTGKSVGYPSEQAALDDASLAFVNFGREGNDLPPLSRAAEPHPTQ